MVFEKLRGERTDERTDERDSLGLFSANLRETKNFWFFIAQKIAVAHRIQTRLHLGQSDKDCLSYSLFDGPTDRPSYIAADHS